ncbi:hypothetical protein GQ44DRAFT_822924 [Phaeosphaeriaceae sp. PMI808]|nr:hypothetical protein GQ44DRAFT_822924 [Phaeosphaeriaceae sp. PMI808]
MPHPDGRHLTDDDYDSVDVEFDDPAEKFRHVGRKTKQKRKASTFTRADSKRWYQEMVQGGTWHETYCLWLWQNRLNDYRTEVLRLSATSTPTHEDICRFAVDFAKNRPGQGKNGTLNYETMRHGLNYINKALIFQYEDYNPTPHSEAKITGALDSLLRQGELTRELTRSREPAGAIVVRRLVMCLLKDAITKGTDSWDSIINDIAMLVLTSCFNCRGGDLMGDTAKANDPRADLPGLRYSDLQFYLGPGSTLSDIESKNKMRNAKNMKDDEGKYFHLFRNSLPEGKGNVMCAVKLVLILALRSGNTYGSTIDAVLEHTSAREDRIIQWRFPDRPVLCGSSSTSHVLDWNKLALRGRATRALDRANDILGSNSRVSLHNLRFGAAEDLQVIHPTAPAGISLDAISNELGHHPVGRLKGVGLVYAQAYSTEDNWSKRVLLEPRQLPFNRLISATNISAREQTKTSLEGLKRKRSQAQVTQDCERQGLDASAATNRQYHSRRAKPTAPPTTDTSILGLRVTATSVDPATHGEEPREHDRFGSDDEADTGFDQPVRTEVQAAWDETNLSGNISSNNSTLAANNALSLRDLKPGGAAVDENSTEAIQALLGDDPGVNVAVTIAMCDKSLLAALTGDALQYVRRLSTVNVLRVDSIRSKRWQAAVTAGTDNTKSVGKASRFRFRCIHYAKGCQYNSAATLYDITFHLVTTCQYDGLQTDLQVDNNDFSKRSEVSDIESNSPARKKTKTRHMCPEPGCGKSYGILGDLTAHDKEQHHAIKCFIRNCKDTTVYYGEKSFLRDHIIPVHPAKGQLHPTIPDQGVATFQCPINDSCQREYRYFTGRSWSAINFRTHCKKDHSIPNNESKKLIPRFPGNPCLYPGCTSTECFPGSTHGERKYARHLKTDHEVLDAADRYEYMWQRVRGLILPMRPTNEEGNDNDEL